ncbi:MAG: zinc-dependent alcohol dehydrogenase [Fastidiosipilaceae bacterium]|jgi:L-iditol 2-dehydrogenase
MQQLFITSVRDFEKNTMGTVDKQDVPMPEPADDEIRVKIVYSSICGSDTHTLTGHLGAFEETTKAMLPMSFGHELSGVIDKVGSKAEALGYKAGDKVVANYARYCYSCDNCRGGKENLCVNMQYCMNGFAEYAVYHVTQVHKLPADYDLKSAALIEPLTIALAAAEQAKISFGKSVAIMGAGGLGLMLVQLARLSGASTITVFDLVEDKRDLALKLGADHTFDSRIDGVVEQAIEAAGGQYDCVLEGTGSTEAAKLALQLIKRDGNGVFFAMYGRDPILPVNLHSDFYWDQKHLHGVIMGAGMFPKAIRLLPRMDMDSLIQKVYPLSEYDKAFSDLYENKQVKILIKMDE